MNDIITYLLTGALFGLTAGITPGPLLTLVISETLRHNRSEGIKIAIAPLVTDIPIVIISLFILSNIASYKYMLGTISIAGGIFIAYLGCDSMKSGRAEFDLTSVKPRSVRKGILVNVLSPHPYLFWLTIGSPIVFKAYQKSPWASMAYVLSFYVMLVGSKILLAFLVDRSRDFMKNKIYVWVLRALGTVLLLFAIIFIKDGLSYFGIL